jgi:hypothetical protein
MLNLIKDQASNLASSPKGRTYGPEGKAKIPTTGTYSIFQRLEFEPDPFLSATVTEPF